MHVVMWAGNHWGSFGFTLYSQRQALQADSLGLWEDRALILNLVPSPPGWQMCNGRFKRKEIQPQKQEIDGKKAANR